MTKIKLRLPNCKVYVMAYHPVNGKVDFPGVGDGLKQEAFKMRTNEVILEANKIIEELTKKHNYKFINVNEGLIDGEGNLKEEFSVEGIHMLADAYF